MKSVISFIDYYWPGYKAGGTIRAFMNQVDYLSSDFEFFIVTRNTDYTDNKPYEEVTADQWNRISPNVNVYYVSAAGQSAGVFRKLLNERVYDVVYIHMLFGFWYSILPLLLAKMQHHSRIIIAPHGCLGKGALAIKSSRKKFFLRIMKMAGAYRGTVFHSVVAHESEDIRTHIGNRVRIGEARELPRRISEPPVRPKKTAGKLSMVTIARISPEKNQLYALEILGRCTESEIRYDLIGPVYSEPYWNKCMAVIETLPSNVRVTYRGSISSEMILQELQGYDIMLLPTTGENFGHTILESFMAGCPVVISDRTPWRNLRTAGIGMDISLDYPEQFAEAINHFAAAGNEEFLQWSERASAYALAYIENPEMLAENKNLFNT